MKICNNLLTYLIYNIVLLGVSSCTFDKIEPEICNHPLQDTVSFQKDIIPIFERECSITGCHSGGTPAGKLSLSADVAFSKLSKKGSGYIDTLDPHTSVLYSSIVSPSRPMPPSGQLDDCSIKIIYKWMEQKAKNN